MMPLYVGPELYMLVNMQLLPSTIDHGFHHMYGSLTELLERQVFICLK